MNKHEIEQAILDPESLKSLVAAGTALTRRPEALSDPATPATRIQANNSTPLALEAARHDLSQNDLKHVRRKAQIGIHGHKPSIDDPDPMDALSTSLAELSKAPTKARHNRVQDDINRVLRVCPRSEDRDKLIENAISC